MLTVAEMGATVALAVGLGLGVGDWLGVGLAGGLLVGDGLGETLGLGDALAEGVAAADGIGDGVALAAGEPEPEGVGDGAGVTHTPSALTVPRQGVAPQMPAPVAEPPMQPESQVADTVAAAVKTSANCLFDAIATESSSDERILPTI